MSGVALLLVAPAAGLMSDALLHAVLARIAPGVGPIRTQFVSFAAGALVTLVLLVLMLSDSPFEASDRFGYLALHALIYACFGFVFFNVISANVSSLRVRILAEMLARDPEPLPGAVLQQRYSARDILRARIERLERGGQIELRDGRYRLRKRGLSLVGGVFAALRSILLKI